MKGGQGSFIWPVSILLFFQNYLFNIRHKVPMNILVHSKVLLMSQTTTTDFLPLKFQSTRAISHQAGGC